MERVPDFSLDPPEPKVAATCCKCGQDIYDFEDFAECDEGYVCPDCIEELVQKEIDWARETKDYSILMYWLDYEPANRARR